MRFLLLFGCGLIEQDVDQGAGNGGRFGTWLIVRRFLLGDTDQEHATILVLSRIMPSLPILLLCMHLSLTAAPVGLPVICRKPDLAPRALG